MKKRISLWSEGMLPGAWRISGFLLIWFSHFNFDFPFGSDQDHLVSNTGGSSDSCEQKPLPVLMLFSLAEKKPELPIKHF